MALTDRPQRDVPLEWSAADRRIGHGRGFDRSISTADRRIGADVRDRPQVPRASSRVIGRPIEPDVATVER